MAHLLKGFSLGAGMCHRGVKVLRKPNSAGMGVGGPLFSLLSTNKEHEEGLTQRPKLGWSRGVARCGVAQLKSLKSSQALPLN